MPQETAEENDALDRVRIRVPVTVSQHAELRRLADSSGLSVSVHVRQAVIGYVNDPEWVRDIAWPRLSRRRPPFETLHIRLPQALRDSLVEIGARTGLTMQAQLRLAMTYAFDGHRPDGVLPPEGA